MHTRPFVLASFGIALLLSWLPGQSLNTELVTNGGFEAGNVSGWTTAAGIANVGAYGTTVSGYAMPPMAVATDIGGGSYLLGASDRVTLRQRIDVSGQAGSIDTGTIDLHLAVHLGAHASSDDQSDAIVSFVNAANQVIGTDRVDLVSKTNRNLATNLLARRRVLPVPAGTRAVDVELFTYNRDSYGKYAYVDNVSAKLAVRVPPAKVPLDTELVVNGTFETGLTGDAKHGWAILAGSADVPLYGTTGTPPFSVSQDIGGGTRLLTNCYRVQLRQELDIAGNAADVDAGKVDLALSAYLGGLPNNDDTSEVRTAFLNAAGQEIARLTLGAVTTTQRRNLASLLLRTSLQQVPAGTRALRFEVQVYGFDARGASVDNVGAMLITHRPPQPQPIDQELLVNGGLETGRCDGRHQDGWTIVVGGPVVYGYGTGLQPPFAVSQKIGGGSYLLGGRSVVVNQRIDVRGNADDIDQGKLDAVFASHLGGRIDRFEETTFKAHFQNGLQQTTQTLTLGPVTGVQRGFQTWLVHRTARAPVPANTRYIVVELAFSTEWDGGLCDNLSAKLAPRQAPQPAPYDQNLLVDPSFEAADTAYLLGTGWEHVTPYAGVARYGTANMPTIDVAQRIGGGTQLAYTWSSNSRVEQQFDLTGNTAAVDAGLVGLYLDGYFGGLTFYADDVELTASFLGAASEVLGTAWVGRVSNVDRGNATTLLLRQGSFGVPRGTRTLRVGPLFRLKSGPSYALADKLSAVLFDASRPGPRRYPGTGEDFYLMSGVNGLPTGGPGHDVKTVKADDLLTLHLVSLAGTFDRTIPILLIEAFPTSSPPRGFLPGLHVSPLFQIAWYGGWRGGLLGPDVLLPNGNDYRFLIPPALSGSLMVQAAVFSLKAKNAFFAASDAHELRF